jgi:hypothetical protein
MTWLNRFKINFFFMAKLIAFFLILTIFPFCSDHHEVTGDAGKIEYTPLKVFSFIPSDISSGTPVRILGYSGGREIRSRDSVYLYEFLCIDKLNNDTIRVFSSLISIDNAENPEPTYTTPHLFEGDKKIYDAVFEIVDPQKEKMYLMVSATSDPKNLDATILDQLNVDLKKFVVLNKSLPLMTEPRFKAAFGCLHFKQQPW